MKDNNKNNINLRIKAEELIKTMDGDKINIQDIKKLIYELQVYQIELELQNEELRSTQNDLEEAKNKYEDLYDFAPIGYFTFNQEGIIIDVNLTGANQLATQRMYIKNLPLVTFIPSEYQETFYLHRKAVIETQEKQVCEITIKRKDKSFFCARIESTPAKSDNGKNEYIRSAIVDITTLKELENTLSDEQERLSVTLKTIGDGIITTNINGNIISINETAEEITGWSNEDVYNKHLSELFSMFNEEIEDKTRKIYKNIIFHDKNNNEKILDIVSASLKNKRNLPIGTVLAFRDQTERNKLESELQKIKNLESIGILAGGIAHDFRNILTSVTSRLSLARLQINPSDNVYSYISEAEKACQRATEITNQLLTFSKGGAPIKQLSSIEEIIRDTVVFALHGSTIDYNFNFYPDLGIIDVDKGQISQVINNIIINAIQAMPDGGNINVSCDNEFVEDNPEIILNDLTIVPGQYIKLSIEDNGCGISEEELTKIFDPYFTSKSNGNGLGLTTSYSIIRKHGGNILVDSKVNAGTTFTIYLPSKPKGETITKKENKKEVISGIGKILIMDDELAVLESLEDMLMFLGYDYVSVREGNKAIRMYTEALEKNEKFDAVMLDLTIKGGMGGKETIRELIKIDPEIKAIVASGYSNGPVISEYKDYGFKACIVKPFDTEELSTVINKVIAENII